MLWGLHMALSQGLLATLIADTAPAELRGTAYGMFNLVTGLALLAASIIAGSILGRGRSPRRRFLAGAVFAALAVLGLLACGLRRGSCARDRHAKRARISQPPRNAAPYFSSMPSAGVARARHSAADATAREQPRTSCSLRHRRGTAITGTVSQERRRKLAPSSAER